MRRLLTGVLFLVGVIAAGPGHQLVHLLQEHEGETHVGHCCGHASAASEGQDVGDEPRVETSDFTDGSVHQGHCAVCSLNLESTGGGAPVPVVRVWVGLVPEQPRELLLEEAVDWSTSERGPPLRA